MKVLLSFAHPDDETFTLAGSVFKWTKAGHQVSLITATYGQRGLSADISVDSPDHLGEIRKGEMENAAKITGISKIHYFGLMDGELKNESDDELTDKILSIMKDEQPDVVITFEKNGGSNHPDHIKMSAVSTEAFKVYMQGVKKHVRLYHTVTPQSYYEQYAKAGVANTGFGTPKGVPDEQITTILDVTDVFDKKLEAIECHKTQWKDVERYKSRMNQVDLKKEFLQLILENAID